MEVITAEQFKEQPIEIQEIFLDWWKPSVGDVYCNLYNNQQDNFLIINKCQLEIFKTFKEDIKLYGVPLFTEGQLRKFIEEKANCVIDISYYKYSGGYDIEGFDINDSDFLNIQEWNSGDDLLQAYWKVACIVAKESL